MLQIFGTPKCKETKKAERYCKERSIPFQFRDLLEKGFAPRELDQLLQQWSVDQLIDTRSQFYATKGYKYLEFNGRDELLEHPQLCNTPILRNNSTWVVGFDPTQMKKLLD